jgi:hypothetical protein
MSQERATDPDLDPALVALAEAYPALVAGVFDDDPDLCIER